MKTNGWVCLVFAMGLAFVLGRSALAQDRNRDDGNREDRGREDRGREGGRDFDPRDILRSADDNNDGWIEQSEVGNRSGYYIRRAAERAGLDPSKPLPADKILQALEAMRAESNGSTPAAGSSSSSSSKPTTPPAVGGFGAPAPAAGGAPAATGFNVPLTASTGSALEKKFDSRVIEYVNDMLRERDVNKNGVLEKNEWTGRWSTPAEESDTNKDNILDKEELCVRIAKRFGGTPGATPGASTVTVSGGPTPGSPFGGGSPPGGDAGRFRGYAEGLLRQYDKNKDGKLDRDEFSSMKSDHQQADVNKDGIITVDELSAKLQAYAGGGPSSGGSSSGGDGERRFGGFGRGSSGGDNKTTAAAPPGRRTTFRTTTPAERLPKGLPDWFLRGDVDGDGQVSMAEYTTSWTEQLAAEFLKHDANGDGIITPQECQSVSQPRR